MRKSLLLLSLIIIVGSILRFYNLGNNPSAAYGDEISFAWNAWNILKTGTDEYGTPYPLQFRAFDDYKSPLPVYLLVPVIRFFGLTTGAVRLPVAVFASATILIIFLMVKKLVDTKVALLSALLLAISPWHLHLSRGFFESTIALFFLLLAVYFFVSLENRIVWLFASMLAFAATLYTYFTPRIMLLLFMPFLFWWGFVSKRVNKRHIILSSIFFLMFILPLIKTSLFDKGLSRIDKLVLTRNERIEKSIVFDRNSVQSPDFVRKALHNKFVYWGREILGDYLEHYSINFWYLYGDSSLRYFLGNMGMFYLTELPFVILGFIALNKNSRQEFKLLLGWLLLAPLPAAIAGRPFGVRSLALVPPVLIMTAAGMKYWTDKFNASRRIIFSVLLGSLVAFQLSYYLVRYHLEYPTYAATWWGWENKAAIDFALKNRDKYDQIYISNFYSGMDLAFGYYTALDPGVYRLAKNNPVTLADSRQFVQFGNIFIGSFDIDENRKNMDIIPPHSLYIGRPEEADGISEIRAPDDGRILFKIHATQ